VAVVFNPLSTGIVGNFTGKAVITGFTVGAGAGATGFGAGFAAS
jgi:hypothetical protein